MEAFQLEKREGEIDRILRHYDEEKEKLSFNAEHPEAKGFWGRLKISFELNFIKDNRYKYLLDGLWVSLTVTFCSVIIGIIIGFIVAGLRKKVNVYDAFIEGAKEGFQTAVRIIPYLIAILVGIGVFRASGAMDMIVDGVRWTVETCGANSDFVGALPTALMKPLSGSGARGMMVDAMTTYGADSFIGRLSCIFQGSTDTTFYILADLEYIFTRVLTDDVTFLSLTFNNGWGIVEHFLAIIGHHLSNALQFRLVLWVNDTGLFIKHEFTIASFPFLQFRNDERFCVLSKDAWEEATQ